jgi:hypothetical protein
VGRFASFKTSFLAWAGGVPRVIAGRWPSLTWASHGMLSLVGGLALSLVLMTGLVLGPLSSPASRPSAAAPASQIAEAASPTPADVTPDPWTEPSAADYWTPGIPDWYPSAGASDQTEASSPTDTPAARPTVPPGATQPSVTASADCGTMSEDGLTIAGWRVSGTIIYSGCENNTGSGGLTVVRAFDATNGKALATYKLPTLQAATEGFSSIAIANGLWYSTHVAGVCFVPNCPAYTSYVRRLDLSSKQVTFDLSGWYLEGFGLGYVWAARPGFGGSTLLKIDPVTLNTSEIPWHFADDAQAYGWLHVVCGALWWENADGVTKVDPATGAVLATFPHVTGLEDTPDECWGVQTLSDGSRFVKIGESEIVASSLPFNLAKPDTYSAPADQLLVRGTTFWRLSSAYGTWAYLQRIDPATWQPVGPRWALLFPSWGNNYSPPAPVTGIFVAGGGIWVQISSEFNYLIRVDIPLTPLPVAASPKPSPTPGVTPTA